MAVAKLWWQLMIPTMPFRDPLLKFQKKEKKGVTSVLIFVCAPTLGDIRMIKLTHNEDSQHQGRSHLLGFEPFLQLPLKTALRTASSNHSNLLHFILRLPLNPKAFGLDKNYSSSL